MEKPIQSQNQNWNFKLFSNVIVIVQENLV